MASRFTIIAVTLVLVFSTGLARSISYMCPMDGQLRSACCCKKAKTTHSDRPKLERNKQCCEVRVSEASQPPAMSKDGAERDRLPTPLAWGTFSPSIHAARPTGTEVLPALGARAPPRGIGPPIFVLNCSYLI
jgi:hypothetical protein